MEAVNNMAITKILHMKESKKCSYLHLKNAIVYILNDEKTQRGALVGSGNCIPRYALKTMLDTKKSWRKEGQRQGYHFIMSFAPGEAAPELAFEIMGEFAKRYLGTDWEYIYAAHDDKEHAHAHLIFNSVCLTDGHKYHYKKGDWNKYIQPITNDLCREYGLSEIKLEEEKKKLPEKNKAYNQWQAENEGRMTWKKIVINDLEHFLQSSQNVDEILSMLRADGYDIKYNADRELLVRPYGKKGFISMKALGEKYDRIFNNREREKTVSKEEKEEKEEDKQEEAEEKKGEGDFGHNKQQKKFKQASFSSGFQKDRTSYRKKEIPPYQKLHLRKYYRAGRLKYRSYRGNQSWRYKKDILRLRQLQSQCAYIAKHGIKTMKDLEAQYQRLLAEEEKLKEIKRYIARCEKNTPDFTDRMEKIKEMQKELWKEKKLAEKIRQESLEAMAEKKAVQKVKEIQKEEKHEYDRGSQEIRRRHQKEK